MQEIDLNEYRLIAGVGSREARELCVMSLAALLAGEPHGDQVSCVCPVVRAFAIGLNEQLPFDERQRLKQVANEVLGTKGSRELERRRAYRCADWAVREIAPIALERAHQHDHARILRGLPTVVDEQSAHNAASAAAARAPIFAVVNAHTAARKAARGAGGAASIYAASFAAVAGASACAVDLSIACLRELCAMRE